eukprot:g26628.t1
MLEQAGNGASVDFARDSSAGPDGWIASETVTMEIPMSFESHTTTATMNAAETSSPDPSADDSVASNGTDAVPASGDATGLEAAFPFSPPTLTEEDIVELELFHPEDEDLEPPASMYGAIPGTVAAVILHVWLLATLHNYIRTEPDVLAARPVAVTIEEKEVEEEKPEKEKDPKLTLANPNDKDHEQKEALNATSVGASRSKEPQVYSAPEPPSPEINPELTRNEVYDIPEGLILDESQVVKGTTGNAPVQIEAALDRVTHEIAMNLRERKVLLVWLIDGSASLKTQREIVAKRMKRIYGELDALQEAGQIPKGKSPLLTGVVSFGLTTHFTTPNPTQNFEEIENAVRSVKIDESGRENVFSAVINVIKRWGKHQLSRRIMIVAVTDESGDDFGALRMAVSTCRRHGAKAYVIGPEAPFGRRKGYVPYVDEYGDSHQIPVDLGPETARYENVQLPFWFEGPQYTYLSSGYGPYGLSRLVSETGGIYFTTNTMTMKGLTPLGTYDSEKLRPFKPDYKYDTPLEYDTDLIKHPLRVAIVQAAKFSREHKPEGTPQLDLKVTPANFRQMATSAQQTVARSQLMVDTILQAFPKGIEKEIDNEQRATPRRQQRQPAFRQFFTIRGVEFTKEQQAQVDALRKKYSPQLQAAQRAVLEIYTPEQRRARRAAFAKARQQKLRGRELNAAVDKALKLSDTQKKQLATALKARSDLVAKVQKEVRGLLTAEQRKRSTRRPRNRRDRGPRIKPTHADLKYGEHERQVMDVWLAKSDTPTPVLVSIHGGGFRGGNKGVSPGLLRACLDSKVSVVAITYRLSQHKIAPAQFYDCARAVQFVRSKAKEWNLDGNRFAGTGGSAGAGLSLWLGFHDDLAKDDSKDPIARQSTRLQCMVVYNGQTSYDPRFIRKLFPENDTYKESALAQLYGVDLNKLDSLPKEKYELMELVSPINHLTKDDGPAMLLYRSEMDTPISNRSIGIHHPRFGKVLKERMDKLGIDCQKRFAIDSLHALTTERIVRRTDATQSVEHSVSRRSAEIMHEIQIATYQRTDRLFAYLMLAQWIAGIAAACWISPRTWSGESSALHIHVWAAVFLGGLTSLYPALLAFMRPGTTLTRHTIAVGQMLTSALLIHLCGGRIETHFHVFGSLAFLACYRDVRVLITATVVVAADHFIRGVFYPQSVFGILSPSVWRSLEHAAWVIFENVFLSITIFQSLKEMRAIAHQRATLEATNEIVEGEVESRVADLRVAQKELNAAKEAAEESDRLKSDFLANMSHEIRTPMTAILGFTDILLENVSAPQSVEAASTIKRNGEYLVRLINDILDISKIEAGRLETELRRFAPAMVVADVASLMRVRAEAKGLKLVIHYEGAVPETIQSDPTRLRQILINVVGNAIKFTETGSVELSIRLKCDSELQFKVSDTGIGVSESAIERIFNPFSQADSSTTRKYGGTGLGLAISKRLAQALGGDVTVTSTPGTGSEFLITISPGPLENVPMISGQYEAVSASSRPKASVGKIDGRILLAEDGPDNQRLITFFLNKAGADVTLAENGQVACELACSASENGKPFDVILMDMQMPVLDGYGATRQLREKGYMHPIIALTANAMSGDRDKCIAAGCDDYATKPIQPSLTADRKRVEMRGIHNMGRVVLVSAGIVLAAAGFSRGNAADQSDRVDYSRDIRPILTAKCFACHGPDKESRQAELRLDAANYAHADRDGSRAVAPGKPAESLVFRRITSRDADAVMPPKETGKTLSAREITLIKRWIAQGAQYTRHWAFVKPRRPKLPIVSDRRWGKNEIDRFILARLEQARLKPSPQADGRTLARRVSLDLIGLQPKPEELDAFLKEIQATSFDAAYEKLVDRLLASPRYGERQARRWLDLARYADTNGYEKDRPRSMWPWRDWVIDALNRDMPFDRFTVEQLAGDLLPGATRSQKIATGFHRNTMLNEEGGIDPLEFRFHAMVDRVATTGTTWLGLTIGCAQCHSHKYDPITHHDYYRLMAFLNNADEPQLDLPDVDLAAAHEKNLLLAKRLLAELPDRWPVPKNIRATGRQIARKRFAKWLAAERARTVRWTVLKPVSAKSNLPLLTIQPDHSIFGSGDTTKNDLFQIEYKPRVAGITAVLLEALPDERLPEHGPGMTYYEGTRGDFFLGEFQLFADGKPVPIATASHSYAKNRYGRNPVSAQLAIDGDPQTGWSVHDRQGERHTAVFVLKKPLDQTDVLKLEMRFGRHFSSSLGRFRISVSTASNAVARDLPPEVEQLLLRDDSRLTDAEQQRLFEESLLNAPELAKHAQAIRKLRKRPDFPTTLVMKERPAHHPRPTFVHKRGEYLSRTEQVTAATPAVLHPMPENASRDRLGLARWIVSPDNPLTARVVVNRQWAAFFGKGIVPSIDDFGVQGDSPTHPKLLDWLAVEFMTPRRQGGFGWSQKTLHKHLVMSATYRQSSLVNPEAVRRDPENRLLSYAPRPRLDAEVIRDSILRAAGLLSTKMHGPGVRPPQPRGITEVTFGSPKWKASQGEDRYRRSIYTFIKRTAPFAMFRTFDAGSGESCVAQRDRSNTPLQALTLLNDVMITEAAQALGRLLAGQSGDDAARVVSAFRRILAREPDNDETRLTLEFLQTQKQRLKSGRLNAEKIAGVKTNAVTIAAWTTLARALFSLDETVTRN